MKVFFKFIINNILILLFYIYSGSLLTRNLADLVKKDHFITSSEYLTTLLVIVPK